MDVKFRDLSIPLKIAIILAWICGVLYAGFFLLGFMEGFLYG